MNRWQKDVYDLHNNGVFSPKPPSEPTLDGYPTDLRLRLILEEFFELAHALGRDVCEGPSDDKKVTILFPVLEGIEPNMPKAIDAIVDILVTTLGAAVAMGIDLDPFWREVQRANSEKGDGPIREDGKRLKPDGWRPPDIEGVLAGLLWMYEYRCPNAAQLRRYNGLVLCEPCCDRTDVKAPDVLPPGWSEDGRCMAVPMEAEK